MKRNEEYKDNTGKGNIGYFNCSDFSNGAFNTKIQKIYFFNEPSWTSKRFLICLILIVKFLSKLQE